LICCITAQPEDIIVDFISMNGNSTRTITQAVRSGQVRSGQVRTIPATNSPPKYVCMHSAYSMVTSVQYGTATTGPKKDL
jgi:hypothetical protein